jgi:hypothetical protein
VNDVMISSGRIRDFFVKAIIVLTPMLILSTGLGLASLAQTAATPAEEEDFAAARHLFDEYKRLDQASDSRLVDFYAPEAKIESDVERKDAPTQKENYDREKFCKLITKTFADPNLAKANAATSLDTPTMSRERFDKKAVKVEFHAYQGDTAMKVNWILHKTSSGQWLIVKEHAVTYRKSLGLTKP